MTAINDLMDTLGQKSEVPIIRDLIDEALAARRRKSSEIETKAQVERGSGRRGFDIKMVDAWGFEPQTPTVSTPSLVTS